MLAFMRKYQKYFYAVITIVIVISFSFFGTYSTLTQTAIHDQVAFTTVSGEKITRSQLEEMALFIGTDSDDKKLFRGVWGPNFLNDGVIRKDFLETGLAAELINAYHADLNEDFKNRLTREAHFQLYSHPQAPFINVRNVWSYFAPAILANYEQLIREKEPLSPSAVQARIDLYLAEKRLPAPYLNQIMRYQERENRWVQPDPNLEYSDLSLFGYHTIEDWFGPRFNHLLAEFLFNAADIAEAQGYRVSKAEALASLLQNAQESFRENQNNPRLGVSNAAEYLDQQLLRMRLDKNKAAKLWQKVLLFRRLFDDVGGSVFVDALPFKTFNQYAQEVVLGDLYRLPPALRFSDFRTLQRFEIYLDAVSKRKAAENGILLMPSTFYTIQDVAKKTPELVYKQYDLEIASANKRHLHAKVGVRETLAWEIDEKNWPALKLQFPGLGLSNASTKEQRLAALDQLDPMTRSRVDQFAREQLLEAHPEWLESALNQAPARRELVKLPLKGPSPTFSGLERGEDLIKILDKAEIGKEAAPLKALTFDGDAYYQIKVIERAPDLEVMTFEEASKTPILDTLVKRALDIHYVQLRTQNPSEYQNSDQSWKPLEEVQHQVVLSYFSKVLSAIKAHLLTRQDKEKYKNLEGERLSPFRFLTQADELQKNLQKNPGAADALTVAETVPNTMQNQFKWRKSPLHLSRKVASSLPESQKLFDQKEQSFSPLIFAPNGDAYFAYIAEKKQEEGASSILWEQASRARLLLGNDAKRGYLASLIPLLQEEKAISFDYLYSNTSSMESDGG
jgi:GcvH upstream region-like protein